MRGITAVDFVCWRGVWVKGLGVADCWTRGCGSVCFVRGVAWLVRAARLWNQNEILDLHESHDLVFYNFLVFD